MSPSASQQFCTFVLDQQLFGAPVSKVEEVIQHEDRTRVPLAPEAVSGMINLRGQIVCAIDLRRRLKMPDGQTEHPTTNVIVRANQGAVSLLVDEIGEVMEVSAEARENPPETLQGVAREVIEAVYKLPDHLLLALDVDRVVELREAVNPKSTRES